MSVNVRPHLATCMAHASMGQEQPDEGERFFHERYSQGLSKVEIRVCRPLAAFSLLDFRTVDSRASVSCPAGPRGPGLNALHRGF